MPDEAKPKNTRLELPDEIKRTPSNGRPDFENTARGLISPNAFLAGLHPPEA